jgi:hypothetical protein
MRVMRSVLVALALALRLLLHGATADAAEPQALALARSLYNAGDYDGAIRAASEARTAGDASDAAALVLARAHLERFRQRGEVDDLPAAQEALAAVRPDRLVPRDHIDLLVGFGQYHFVAEAFGPAAELFESALAEDFLLEREERLRLLDWWANAVDRAAQSRQDERLTAMYERILRRMDAELQRDVHNPVANYWLAVAARGAGDPERAWDAAVAAWVRMRPVGLAGTFGRDLDRLVTEAIIPERARLRRETADAARTMREEWELIKEQWK